jgi:membrane protein DedA with SNARE-associated domain
MPALIAHYGVFIVVLIIYAGEIGIPTLVPGEIAILVAASQLVRTVPQLIGMWALFAVVDILACTSIHTACRTGGNRALLRLLRCLQPNAQRHEDIVDGWRRRLGGRDAAVVFVTRLIPMFRLYASVTTGLIRVRFRDWVAGAVPASTVWAATPLVIGFVMRARIRAVEEQYPQLIHYVIFGSIAVIVLMALSAWLRHAGTRAGSLRRLRVALSLGAAGGALSRLALVGVYGDKPLSHWSLAPWLSALSVWITCLSLVALGLLWLAARDLNVISRLHHHRARTIGLLSTGAWSTLMMMFCALTTLGAVAHPAVLA